MEASIETISTDGVGSKGAVNKEVTIYWISDIHLELRKKIPKGILCELLGLPKDERGNWIDETYEECSENRKYRILILAGDIGNPHQPLYKLFLAICMNKFRHVFIITGNHEYYSGPNQQHTICETNRQLESVCRTLGGERAGIYVLAAGDNDSTANVVTLYDYGAPIRFIGCTMWTEVDARAEMVMNDYNMIYVGDGTESSADSFPNLSPRFVRTEASDGLMRQDFMTPTRSKKRIGARKITYFDVLYGMHQPHREHIAGELDRARADNVRTVVVTHHAPSYKMLKEMWDLSDSEEELLEGFDLFDDPNTKIYKRYGPQAQYYATDLEHLIESPVILWVSGHTHDSKSVAINGIQCSSNCYGYPQQTAALTKFSSAKMRITL